MVLIILFSWLRMGEICRSPFDGDSIYDIKVLKEIDHQIYTSSLALQSAKLPNDFTKL